MREVSKIRKNTYRRKVIRAGMTIDVEETFPTRYGEGLTRAGKKANGAGTPVDVEAYNHILAVRKLTRTLNCNFKTDDWWITLTYEKHNRPKTVEEAKKQVSQFIAGVKKRYAESGIEFKYVKSVPAIGERGAIHHHLVIPQGVKQKDISAVWRKVIKASPKARPPDFTPLYDTGDYSALAAYIIGQKQETKEYSEIEQKYGAVITPKKNVKKWTGSHNLEKPVIEVDEIIPEIKWKDPPAAKRGYYIDVDSIEKGTNPVTGQPYQFYRQIKLRSDFECWDGNGKKLSGKEAIKYFRAENKRFVKEYWKEYMTEFENSERRNE